MEKNAATFGSIRFLQKNSIIDSEGILNVAKQVLAEKEKENAQQIQEEIERTKSRHFFYKLENRAPRFLVKRVQPFFSSPEKVLDLVDFNYNKMICLNFLNYCLENAKQLRFDLDLFEAEADKQLLLEYIWNNIYVAVSSNYPPKNPVNKEYRQKYDSFRKNIHKKGDAYILTAGNQTYALPLHHFEEVVFFHKYGTGELPVEVKDTLADTDFIDAGAFIGDTALILNELNPHRIYSFEPCAEQLALLEKTLKMNKLTNVVPVRSALGNQKCSSKLFLLETASFLTNDGEGGEEVPVTTIDSFREQNGLDVGLIKMDIEGSEFKAVQGAEKTIKTDKPVLIISLYHTGRDFFEVPPLLKKWVPSYHFRFLSLHKGVPILERVLLAY
ncbi:MAG: FkbM family methyltransferase [Candidatus Bathyarchaeota archaeon]|nr:FkbM family methyltransferase [Candidatus Bathyarchaeota archaeon]